MVADRLPYILTLSNGLHHDLKTTIRSETYEKIRIRYSNVGRRFWEALYNSDGKLSSALSAGEIRACCSRYVYNIKSKW